MTFPVHKTSPDALLATAASHPGTIYESNRREMRIGDDWAAFIQGQLVGTITYLGHALWMVRVVKRGRTVYAKREDTYTNALARLQEMLAKYGGQPVSYALEQ